MFLFNLYMMTPRARLACSGVLSFLLVSLLSPFAQRDVLVEVATAQQCTPTSTVSLGSQTEIRGGLQADSDPTDGNGNYRPLSAALRCPAGQIVTTLAYNDDLVNGPDSDAMDAMTIGCATLNANGTVGATTMLPNSDFDGNPRPAATVACPAGQVALGFRGKDSPPPHNTDIFDGITTACAPLSSTGLGALQAPAPNGDIDGNSRQLIDYVCPSGYALVGVEYVHFGPGQVGASADATDAPLAIQCQQIVTTQQSCPVPPPPPIVSCKPLYKGVTNVFYTNGQSNSQLTHVTLPVSCPNPAIVTQTYTESVACGTGSGPATCVNNPGTTSTDVHSRVGGITNNGFDVFLSADDAVWVGASSPAFSVAWQVTCGSDPSVPVCTPHTLISGFVNVDYPGTTVTHSAPTHVAFPATCSNPSIVTRTYRDSAACTSFPCVNNPGTASTDVHSYVSNRSANGFDIFMSADDAVRGPLSSRVTYQVACDAFSSNRTMYSGVVPVTYTSANSHSGITRVNFPAACSNPSIVTQNYRDSAVCSTSPCHNSPGTNSTDIHSYITGLDASGFGIFLSSDDGVQASTTSNVAWQLTCDNTLPPPPPPTAQCQDNIDNDGDGATDFPGDFSCSSATDNDETNPRAVCQDGVDNDSDGLIDFPQDPGCGSRQDNDEFNQTQPTSCTPQDPRVAALTQLYGVQPRIAPSGRGETLVYWDVHRPSKQTIFQQLQQQNLQPLRPGNYTDSAIENLIRSFTSDYRYVAIDGACNQQQLLAYHSEGHRLSKDRDCNATVGIELQHKVNYFVIPSNAGAVIPDAAFGGTVTFGSAGERIDGPGDGGDNGFVAAICSAPTPVAQCRDGIDNDGDGATDFTGGDFSCSSADDTDETNPRSQCQDGIDNDGDGLIDFSQDPGCASRQDNDEFNAASSSSSSSSSAQPQCQDNIDNDGDGAVDFPQDFSCSSSTDNDEMLPRAACQDGFDNDGDGLSDANDPGCHVDGNPNNANSYNRQDNDEFNVAASSSSSSSFTAQCQDGIDNDGDGATDFPSDFSCSSANDTDETNPRSQCQDFVDNDGDGFVDFPQDSGCSSRQDNDEFTTASSSSSSSFSSSAPAGLSIQKSGPATAVRGNVLTYTIVVSNTGTVNATNVVVSDPVPSGLAFLFAGSNDSCALIGNTVQCALGTIASGQSKTFIVNFNAPVLDGCIAPLTIQNVATVTSTQFTTSVSPAVSTHVQCQAGPLLSITKTDSRTTVAPGETLTYTITITNSAAATATNVTVTDTLPSTLTFLSASDSGTQNGQVVTWNNLTISGNSSRTLTLQARVQQNLTSGTVIVNTAQSGGQATGTDSTTVQGSTGPLNVSLDVSDAPDPVEIEEEVLRYQIRISNLQATSGMVTVTQVLPQDIAYLSASDNGVQSNGVVTWTLTLNGNETKTLTSSVRVRNTADDGDTLRTSVFANSASDEETTRVRDRSDDDDDEDVTIRIIDTPDPVDAGDTLTYELEITNESDQDQEYDLTAFLDDNVEFISASDDGEDVQDDEVEWSNIFVEEDDSETLTLRVRVDDDLDGGDTVELRVELGDEEEEEETRIRGDGPINTPVETGPASIAVFKQADRTEAQPGDQVGYSITVRNTSNVTIQNVVVEDRYDTGKITITDPGDGQLGAGALTWRISTLRPGETRVISYRAALSPVLRNGDSIINTVRVTANNLQTVPTSVSTITILQQLPQTGFSSFTRPLSGNAFLSPLSSTTGATPAIVWTALAMLGVGVGGRIGRRLFFF